MTLSGLLRTTTLVASGCIALSACSDAPQTTASQQQLIVDRATLAVQDLFAGTTPQSRSQKLLAEAKAVMVCPSVLNMSFGIGGSGGRCLLLSRDARGSWSDPAFYRLSTASLGLQVGVQSAETILFIMSQRGIQAILDSQFKFDASASASFASIGTGLENSTAGAHNTDIYAAQKNEGLYAGAALGGSKLTVDSGANRAYYNQTVGPEDIVVTMRVNNPSADPLRRALMSVAQTPAAASTVSSRATQAATTAAQDVVGNSPYPTTYDASRPYSAQTAGVQSQSLAPLKH
ncbi:lipid-binding SYLF domain-containing protein [Gluconobacter kondonii]|uniref:lipid-binding SYLF domain-containing protein n=1 Tax=Gluconobacter kondonii TaxID=941463 RepID=UPI001B8C8D83|nr:lipid-binding SYLF domain-containing protein [Gluconobacter kondonii]MBS1066285.1 lipid-binding SYLF domain-containing protein [Gluconobacter kondonii]MBS1081019.1 lipid-binding SYLF domain-containing protein [Gluconobacter kondonii]MBS1081915.1 lipid-binding SYLF domain-containing protein [Gluconobacter kondonii]